MTTDRLVYLLFMLMVTVLYGQTLQFGHVWDDHIFFLTPFSEQSIDFKSFMSQNQFTVHGRFFRPLFLLSIWFDYIIHEFSPGPAHFFNLVIFYFTLLFMYKWSRLITSKWISVSAVLVFIAVPITVESVAFISSRDTLLSGLGIFWSLYNAELYRQNPAKHRFLMILFVSSTLAILSKESGLILPLIIGIHTLFFPTAEQNRLTPGLNIQATVWLSMIFYFLCKWLFLPTSYASFPLSQFMPDPEKCLHLPILVLKYVEHIFYPLNLSAEYLGQLQDIDINYKTMIAGIFMILLIQRTLVSQSNLKLRLMASFLSGLLPFMHLFPIHRLMTDRWAYVSSFFLILAVINILFTEINTRFMRRTGVTLMLVILILYGRLSYKRTGVWRNDHTLFHSILIQNPYSLNSHYNLGNYYFNLGNYDKSSFHFEQALLIDPKHVPSLTNLGYVHLQSGHDSLSEFFFNTAIALFEENEYAIQGLNILERRRSSSIK